MQYTRYKIRVRGHEPRATNKGLTLMEMTVVMAVVAMLAVFGLPAVRTLLNSFESRAGARAMISASLASARAIAAKEQRYAGVRFQNRYQQDNKGCQYMIFIIYDAEIPHQVPGNLGCRAVEGVKPIKLPDSVGVMDLRKNSNDKVDDVISEDDLIDTTTFSILFSPSGKLIIHSLWVRNREGKKDDSSEDDIFNTLEKIEHLTQPRGMFVQDEPPDIEPSRRSFIIYDKTEFDKVDENRRWSDYLTHLEVIYINPYTGTMIER